MYKLNKLRQLKNILKLSQMFNYFNKIILNLLTKQALTVKQIYYMQAWWLNNYSLLYKTLNIQIDFSVYASIKNYCSLYNYYYKIIF